jgi:hypothetical protein
VLAGSLSLEQFSQVSNIDTRRDFINACALDDGISEMCVRIRPSATLEFEEAIGLLRRGGSVVCVGSRQKTIFTFLLEKNNEILNKYQGHQTPEYLREAVEACSKRPLWSVEVSTSTFLSDDPLLGADALATIASGVRAEVLIYVDIACSNGEKNDTVGAIAKAVVSTMCVPKKRETAPTRQNSGILRALCASVKRGASVPKRSDEVRPIAVPVWCGTAFRSGNELVPAKNRNSWVLPGGETVEVLD